MSQADKRTGLRRSLHPDGEEPLCIGKLDWRLKIVYGRLLIAQGARPRCWISNPQSTIFNRCAYQLRYFTPNAGQVPAIFVVAPQAAQVQDDPIQPAELCLAFRYR